MRSGRRCKKCYEESIEWSTLLIEKKAGFYELERTSEEVCTKAMKGIGASQENILEFELDRFQTYPMAYFPGRVWITWPVKGTETPGSVVTKDFVIKAERRLKIFTRIRMTGGMNISLSWIPCRMIRCIKVNQGYAYVYKWRDVVYRNVSWSPTPQVAYIDVNYSYWRLADIYLLRAECYAKLGDDLAKADLNKIRNRAHATPYPAREKMTFNWRSLKNGRGNFCLKDIGIMTLYGMDWNTYILIWMVITKHWISKM